MVVVHEQDAEREGDDDGRNVKLRSVESRPPESTGPRLFHRHPHHGGIDKRALEQQQCKQHRLSVVLLLSQGLGRATVLIHNRMSWSDQLWLLSTLVTPYTRHTRLPL